MPLRRPVDCKMAYLPTYPPQSAQHLKAHRPTDRTPDSHGMLTSAAGWCCALPLYPPAEPSQVGQRTGRPQMWTGCKGLAQPSPATQPCSLPCWACRRMGGLKHGCEMNALWRVARWELSINIQNCECQIWSGFAVQGAAVRKLALCMVTGRVPKRRWRSTAEPSTHCTQKAVMRVPLTQTGIPYMCLECTLNTSPHRSID